MEVSVSLLPSPMVESYTPDVAVVIDVLRATSVMATAMNANAAKIITCKEIAQARQWKEKFEPGALLCGERQCQRIEGFDLGNSPNEYVAAKISGRTLVLTTTNGTRAITSVQHAKRIITASFLNFTAVVDAIADAKTVRLVCAGTDGHETDEDMMLAGAIARAAADAYDAEVCGDDAVRAVQHWNAFQKSGRSLVNELRETGGGRNLVRYGFEDDLASCARVDSFAVVPEQIKRDPPTFACITTKSGLRSRNASV
jgi:2-phosphosulfolactate phosphatase